MTYSVRKFISSLLSLTTALGMTGLGLVASNAYAGQLTQSKVTLSDSRSGVVATHTIAFNVAATTAIKGIRLQYRRDPSGTAAAPQGIGLGSGSLTSVTGGANTGSWSAVFDGSSNFEADLTNTSGSGALSAGATISVVLANITNNTSNPAGGNQCDSVADSDTCYIRITTFNTDNTANWNAGSTIDSSVTSYTVITPITVTATVDPSLNFTVGAVSGANIDTNDANASCGTTNVVDTTTTTIPFGNLKIATAKCAQQSLTIVTNASNGYTIYQKFYNDGDPSNMMIGSNTANNIDPYTGTFGTPTTFAAPTGTTPSVNTGFLGTRSNTIGAFAASNKYAGPFVGAGSGSIVMSKGTPDDGTTPTYVTYKIQVDANQPADLYTGTLFYSVLANY